MVALVGTSAIAADLPSKDMPKAPTMPTLEDNSWYGGLAVGGITGGNSWYRYN